MDTETAFQSVHRLVEAYNERELSMADYRLRRRSLLIDIDARLNGVERPVERDSDQITLRKQR